MCMCMRERETQGYYYEYQPYSLIFLSEEELCLFFLPLDGALMLLNRDVNHSLGGYNQLFNVSNSGHWVVLKIVTSEKTGRTLKTFNCILINFTLISMAKISTMSNHITIK